jgi:hypothetical protein
VRRTLKEQREHAEREAKTIRDLLDGSTND